MAYDPEFREEVTRQVQARTKPIGDLERELGVHVLTLRTWRRDARIGTYDEAGSGARTVEEEDRDLRRDNARLREGREIPRMRGRRVLAHSATAHLNWNVRNSSTR
jgi:transposase-like protein